MLYNCKALSRLKEKVKINSSGCWEWIAQKSDSGYGEFSYLGKKERAHRVSYLIHKGDIPDGMVVCHSCDNKSCVNPDHLWLGTQKDNIEDAVLKGRMFKARGESNSACKYPDWKINLFRRAISIYGRKNNARRYFADRLGINLLYTYRLTGNARRRIAT